MKIHNFSKIFNYFQIYSLWVGQDRIVWPLEDQSGIFYVVLSVQVCVVVQESLGESLHRQASRGQALSPRYAYLARVVGDVAC